MSFHTFKYQQQTATDTQRRKERVRILLHNATDGLQQQQQKKGDGPYMQQFSF